jgi:hypothetical protein
MALMASLAATAMATSLAFGSVTGAPSPSAPATEAQWKHRLDVACARVEVAIDRVERRQYRIAGDASTRGSIERLESRAERLEKAGQPQLAQLVRSRIVLRTQIAELLPKRLEALKSAQQVCQDAGKS